jgi:hypothetical protein
MGKIPGQGTGSFQIWYPAKRKSPDSPVMDSLQERIG